MRKIPLLMILFLFLGINCKAQENINPVFITNLNYDQLMQTLNRELKNRSYSIEYCSQENGVLIAVSRIYGEMRERIYLAKIDVSRQDKDFKRVTVAVLCRERYNAIMTTNWSTPLLDRDKTTQLLNDLMGIIRVEAQ